MSLKFRGLLAICIGTVLGLALSLGSSVLAGRQHPAPVAMDQDPARLLAEVLEHVRREYVDPVNDQRLMEAAIRGMVAGLDDHSAFLDAVEYQQILDSTSGAYTGIGLDIGVEDGHIVVIAPIAKSPAAAAGVLAGDIIISVDGMPVGSQELEETVARLRGEAGSRVRLSVVRGRDALTHSFDIQRAEVHLASVEQRLLDSGYAYLRLSHFSGTTAAEVEQALADLAPEHLLGLVIDLRNNPGGVLDAAVEVADLFLDSGVIVSADGQGPDARFRYSATIGELLPGRPIVVLVNAGSASASEILAGALQDNGRARIIGSPTFGKGSVQTVLPLSDGHAIKLTTSRYYTPSGRSIHNRGIQPDVTVYAEIDDSDIDRQLEAAVAQLDRGETGAAPRVAASGTGSGR
jgi:carboxyl-terminal processing protease